MDWQFFLSVVEQGHGTFFLEELGQFKGFPPFVVDT